MTPAARIAACIEVMQDLLIDSRPADRFLQAWFRSRRYVGSKDRHDIADRVYRILRHRLRLSWKLDQLEHPVTGRSLTLAALRELERLKPEEITRLCDGHRFSPAKLKPSERAILNKLHLQDRQMPEAVWLECPLWAETGLRAALGDDFATEMQALLEEAPMDMRVNPLKSTREEALAKLQQAGYEVTPTPRSPFGIRSAKRFPIGNLPLFAAGEIEVQDESAQIAALLVDAHPGMQVVDFCAGAGGKSLLIGAMMQNKGRIIAADVLEGRLQRARKRYNRAGLDLVELKALSSERDQWIKRNKGRFDRVLLDVPCSGTGTWRRNPDMRWQSGLPDLEELQQKQAAILQSAARLVKPEGRLIYATCSLLREENEMQIEQFLAEHSDFHLIPVSQIWAEMALPEAAPLPEGDTLRLSPAAHGSDGFFCAVMARDGGED